MGGAAARGPWLEARVNIGRPQRIIEVEPVTVPLPDPVEPPAGPAPAEPAPAQTPAPEPVDEPAG